MTLAERVLRGEAGGVARLITLIENNSTDIRGQLKELYPHTGRSYIVGITGAPGSGKSSLVDKLTLYLRREGKTVGIIAVDPTSPFSGGAILGDRVRMQRHTMDEGVFIRSMATRGALGGLSLATNDAVMVLDASGKDVIIVETVGVGQDEVEIVKTAHTTVVVTVPGLGDDVQAIKAGILEIGDIFAVNKADREGADETARELEVMLSLSPDRVEGWRPPIVKTIATGDQGVEDLLKSIYKHKEFLGSSGLLFERKKVQSEAHLTEILKETLTSSVFDEIGGVEEFRKYVDRVASREMDPYSAVEEMIARAGG